MGNKNGKEVGLRQRRWSKGNGKGEGEGERFKRKESGEGVSGKGKRKEKEKKEEKPVTSSSRGCPISSSNSSLTIGNIFQRLSDKFPDLFATSGINIGLIKAFQYPPATGHNLEL
jgi:hypothetical protein